MLELQDEADTMVPSRHVFLEWNLLAVVFSRKDLGSAVLEIGYVHWVL